ncbi:hypothetical protein PG993_014998 [Apiospora rasikravindrae]|uniref:Uncharacterized protein n=1 Tax=Apiospora rasikravindrae TaxID=990691 RepID=A0ABR1RPD2_9PEZI
MSMQSEPTFDVWATAQNQLYQPPSGEQLAAFRNLFHNSSPSAAEVSEIASRIAKPCIKPWGEGPIQGLWCVIQSAVDELPSQSDRLVALVTALQRLPDGRGVLGPDSWFIDLPLFDNHWTERVNVSYPDPHKGRQAWLNQNAFLAKLTARAGDVEIFREQRQRGGVCLRRSLERTPGDDNEDGDDKEEEGDDYEEEEDEEEIEDPSTQITVLDVLVPAAAQWIQHCPRVLYEKAVAGGEMDSEYDHNGTNFGTKMGWSLERWEYWRKRFEVSTMDELEEGTRRIAKEAAEIMGEFTKNAP